MQYYNSEYEFSLCFVKGIQFLLFLCPDYVQHFFFLILKKGHNWNTHTKVSESVKYPTCVRHEYDTPNKIYVIPN